MIERWEKSEFQISSFDGDWRAFCPSISVWSSYIWQLKYDFISWRDLRGVAVKLKHFQIFNFHYSNPHKYYDVKLLNSRPWHWEWTSIITYNNVFGSHEDSEQEQKSIEYRQKLSGIQHVENELKSIKAVVVQIWLWSKNAVCHLGCDVSQLVNIVTVMCIEYFNLQRPMHYWFSLITRLVFCVFQTSSSNPEPTLEFLLELEICWGFVLPCIVVPSCSLFVRDAEDQLVHTMCKDDSRLFIVNELK